MNFDPTFSQQLSIPIRVFTSARDVHRVEEKKMMNKRFAGLTLAAVMMMAPFATQAVAQQGPPPPPPGYGSGYGPAYGWDAPPRDFQEIQRQGFHDGIYGARKDFENHRRPTPNNRDEYRRPPVSPRDRYAYRMGFERGYRVGWDHIMNRGGGYGFYGR